MVSLEAQSAQAVELTSVQLVVVATKSNYLAAVAAVRVAN